MFQISKTSLTKKGEPDMTTAGFSLVKWTDVHAVMMILATVVTIVFQQPLVLVLCAVWSFISLFFTASHNVAHKNVKWSVANLITGLRLMLVLLVLSFFNELSLIAITALLTLSVCLDVLDGYVARKTSCNTEFGQYFDMESDAFFVLAMGVYFWTVTPFGLWLLLPGLLRYLYRLAMRLAPKVGFTEKKRDYAAFLAGVNFVLLLLALVLPGWLQLTTLILSTAIVCCSFGLSFIEYALFKAADNSKVVE